ncbi:MAG: glutamate-5-semialdehyde dehydrogenase [bacterium]|nr:glutamate-5-semialdehyde dehydrogenase [bacterium]
MDHIIELARKAKDASRTLANISSEVKNKALLLMAEHIRENRDRIIKENEIDVRDAKRANLSSAFIDRLTLSEHRIEGMINGLKDVASLPDPVGEIIRMWRRPNGLQVGKMRVPLGVVMIIYESRPNVTVEATSLCLKSGNAVILRGGKEAFRSNRVIAKILRDCCREVGIPSESVSFVETTSRKAVKELIKFDDCIDVIIPRGGEEMIREIRNEARVPVIAHGKGNCHVYIDKDADLQMALDIAYNAKVQRPGVCNAMETLLVHKDKAREFLPKIVRMLKDAKVEIRGCKETKKIVGDIRDATESDWFTEYLDLILAVKVVDSIDDAISHIAKYGSCHTEAIVTSSYENSQRFLREVDAAAVFVNASTRFTDGGEFGLGAEIGISTQKLHARGPMGLEELTSTKFIIFGEGQIRE